MKGKLTKLVLFAVASSTLLSCGKADQSTFTNGEDVVSSVSPIVISPAADLGVKTKYIKNKDPNNSTGYDEIGDWTNSALAGFQGRISRYTNEVGAYASYTTDQLGSELNYCVSIYRVTHGNSTDQAKILIKDNGSTIGEKVVTYDLNNSESGWYHLGEYSFSGNGGEASVQIGQNTSNNGGFLRADDVRFKRLDDGRDCYGNVYANTNNGRVIDNKNGKIVKGYREEGNWFNSVFPGRNGTISRYSADFDASVTYFTNIKHDQYCISLYRVTNPNSVSDATITISQDGDTVDTQSLDYSLNTSESGWVQLGDFSFDTDKPVELKIERNSSGYLRADAIKFKKGTCQ